MFVIDRGSIFLPQDPIYYQSSWGCSEVTKLGSLLHKPCTSPKFETLPSHFIPWHPLPTQHSLRYLRCSSFLSCRVACSPAPHTTPFGLLLLGHTLPRSTIPVTATSRPLHTAVMATAPLWSRPSAQAGTGPAGLPSWSRRRHVPFTPRSWPRHHPGHVPRPGPARVHLLLPRRDCLPTRLPQRDRPGRNASPQDPEPITVRLPWGTGHGKGPCSAQADLVSPKVVPVTPPAAQTDNRSRHSGSGALPDPSTSRLDARAAQSPFALAEQANLPNVLAKDPTGNGSHGVRGHLGVRPGKIS